MIFFSKVLIRSFFFILPWLMVDNSHALIDFKTNTLIVDDEIEEALTQWAQQLFRVAGLSHHQPNIYLIANPEVNAAATIGGVIIIYTGLFVKCSNASQFLGVLAHEVGHIAGGHVSRQDEAIKEALVPASAAAILGGALAVATGDPSLLMAGFMGSSHAFGRSMLKFNRMQEASADQAAADYLKRLGWGVKGLYDFFHILDDKSTVYTSMMSPYELTHPLTRDRISSLEMALKNQSTLCPPVEIEAAYQRIRGKIIGYFDPPHNLLTNISQRNLSPEGEKYAKAVAFYRLGRYQDSLKTLEELLQQTQGVPRSGWYYEMKGQILFDLGKVQEAVTLLKKASTLRPKALYLKVMLAHALLEMKAYEEARKILIPLTQKAGKDHPFAWRLLARAHGKENEPGLAALALAEEAYQKQEIPFAKSQALKALKMLDSGSPGAQRAKDLLKDCENY